MAIRWRFGRTLGRSGHSRCSRFGTWRAVFSGAEQAVYCWITMTLGNGGARAPSRRLWPRRLRPPPRPPRMSGNSQHVSDLHATPSSFIELVRSNAYNPRAGGLHVPLTPIVLLLWSQGNVIYLCLWTWAHGAHRMKPTKCDRLASVLPPARRRGQLVRGPGGFLTCCWILSSQMFTYSF